MAITRAVRRAFKQNRIKRSLAKGLVLRLSFWSLLAAASLFQWLASGPRLVLSGHENYITSLAFAPDGRFLASGSADRTIKIWHPSTGENLKTLSMVKPAPIPSLVFSADGKQLALGGWNKLAFMNVEDGKELSWIDLTTEGGGRLVHAVLLSPDGKTLISAGMNSLRLWDIDSKAIRRRLLDENKSFFQAESVALSHGGKLLASGSNRGLVTLWEMNQEKKLYSFAAHGDKSKVSALTFAPDDRLLATGGADARTVLWQLSPSDAPKEILTLKANTGGINSIAFSADGKLLATAAYDLRAWQVATGKLLFMIQGRRVKFTQVDFSPDGQTLAAGGEDGLVELWDVGNQTKRLTLKVEDGFPVLALRFSPDGKILAGATAGGQTIFWDPKDGAQKRLFKSHDEFVAGKKNSRTAPVDAVAVSPDSKLLAAGSGDIVTLWDTEDWRVQRHFWLGGSNNIKSLQFFPSGKLLAGNNDGASGVWDISSGTRALPMNQYLGSAATLSPDGKVMAAVPHGIGTVSVWNTSNWQRLFLLRTSVRSVVFSLAFSPDGSILAGGDGKNSLALWTTPDRQYDPNVLNKIGCGDEVGTLTFSPNGKWLAALAHRAPGFEGLSKPGCIKLFRFQDNQFSFMSWQTEPGGKGLAFSPDSKTLATPAPGDKIKLWTVD